MPYRFSNDLLALKKCYILHIENLKSNKKFGYQAFNDHSAEKLIAAFYAVDFMQFFIILDSLFPRVFCKKV